jgi:hypothetical protein
MTSKKPPPATVSFAPVAPASSTRVIADVRALLDQNRVRAPGYALVKQHDLLLERPATSRG